MIVEQMSNWLIGSILFVLGSMVLVLGVVLINNLLHKFWKPVTVVYMRNESVYPRIRFATPEDNVKDPEFESPKPVDKTKD
jgi:hypothetical protein